MIDDLLTRLQAAQSDEERAWIGLQFSLDSLDPPVQEAVWAAAIPHWVDLPFLAALLAQPPDAVQPIFAHLITLSFVEPFPGRGYNIHERTRALLLDRLWQDNRDRYRELSRRAAAYCAQQDQEDVGWRIETIYHSLLAGDATAVDAFVDQTLEWHNSPNFAYDKVEALVRPILIEAAADRITGSVVAWTHFFQAVLHNIYNRYHDARHQLEEALAQPDVDDQLLTAHCLKGLGEVHWGVAEYAAARGQYEAALALYRTLGNHGGEANCIQSLGGVHLRLAEYAAARGQYEAALALYRTIGDRQGEANCIKSLGDVHYSLGDYAAARGQYEAALSLYRTMGNRLGEANCIQSLGDVHLRLAEYAAARGQYEAALSLYRTIGDRLGEANCIRSLGDLAIAGGDEEGALAQYREALARYQALGLANDIANVFTAIADVYDRRKAYTTGLAYYTQAIEVAPTNAMWYRNRASAYVRLKDVLQAEADLATAARLQPDHSYLHLRYGDLALLQGNYAAAKARYQAFIDALPRNNLGYFGLARACFGQAQAESGLDALATALSLTYTIQDVEEAITDLNDMQAANPDLARLDAAIMLLRQWIEERSNTI